jgi:hypothetical protein
MTVLKLGSAHLTRSDPEIIMIPAPIAVTVPPHPDNVPDDLNFDDPQLEVGGGEISPAATRIWPPATRGWGNLKSGFPAQGPGRFHWQDPNWAGVGKFHRDQIYAGQRRASGIAPGVWDSRPAGTRTRHSGSNGHQCGCHRDRGWVPVTPTETKPDRH